MMEVNDHFLTKVFKNNYKKKLNSMTVIGAKKESSYIQQLLKVNY